MATDKIAKLLQRAMQRHHLAKKFVAETAVPALCLGGNNAAFVNVDKARKCPVNHSMYSSNGPLINNLTEKKLSTSSNPQIASEQRMLSNKQSNKIVNSFTKKITRYLMSFAFQQQEIGESSAKPYSSIPGPKGLPLLGSALEYTMLGKFSPKEYNKALEYNHNK